jgi:hypothetical protein
VLGAPDPLPADQGEAAPAAPERHGLIRDQDLDEVVPLAGRRVGDYRRNVGTMPVAGGLDWDDLDLTRHGGGMKADPAALRGYWNDAVDKVKAWSPEQAAALEKYFTDHPEVGPGTPEFWDNALKQLDRARYWYEISTRKFQNEGLDTYPQNARLTFNTLAATSPNAEPEPNLRRTVSVLSEHQQQLPSATDLLTPGSVRQAFQAGTSAPKVGNFGGTFAHIAGIDDKPPISVNDRQVAEIHGINREELAKNPALYGVLSHFYQNFRDGENAARPGVATGEENPFESWQLQALGWTQNRADKREAKAGEAGIDDYAQVIDRLKGVLNNAGIDTRRGLFSRDVLAQPLVPDLMSTTRRMFLDTPIATVETGSTMHPEGARAAELFGQLPRDGSGWADTARAAYEAIQRRAMRRLTSAGEGYSVLDRLAAPIVGAPVQIRRVDTQGGWGHFAGDFSPNVRIPMWATVTGRGRAPGAEDLKSGDRIILEPRHIKPLLAALGQDLQQRANVASLFRERTPEEAAGPTPPDTFSVFLPEFGTGRTPVEQLDQFGRNLGRYLNIARGPTGTLADINPNEQPLPASDITQAADRAFGAVPYRLIARRYDSHYLVHQDEPDAQDDGVRLSRGEEPLSYDWHLNNFWDQAHADDQLPRRDDTRGVRGADWTAQSRRRDFDAARAEVRAIADQARAETADWIKKYERRIGQAEPRGEPLKGPPGALSAAQQYAQPPPAAAFGPGAAL